MVVAWVCGYTVVRRIMGAIVGLMHVCPWFFTCSSVVHIIISLSCNFYTSHPRQIICSSSTGCQLSQTRCQMPPLPLVGMQNMQFSCLSVCLSSSISQNHMSRFSSSCSQPFLEQACYKNQLPWRNTNWWRNLRACNRLTFCRGAYNTNGCLDLHLLEVSCVVLLLEVSSLQH